MSVVPLLFALNAGPLTPTHPYKKVTDTHVVSSVDHALSSPKAQSLPDMSANYLHTVVEPREALQRQKDEEARVAAQKATEEAQAALEAAQAPPPPPPAPTDGNASKMFIYMMESGNRTNAINASSGACGLGQALPCSKMGCNLSDYACQDAFFTNYMLSRYGSWDNAAAFWRANRWW